MTPSEGKSDLVERLRDDVQQLTKMAEHAKLAGPETDVRVKNPSLLLDDLSEAAATISRLERELAEARRHIEALQEKDASQCACSIDTPDDVCLFHARMKDEARRQAFEEAAQIATTTGTDAENDWPGETWIAGQIASALRAKAEEPRT